MVALADSDPRIAGVFERHCAYPEASPTPNAIWTGTLLCCAGQPVVWLDDKARYDRDEPYRQRLHFFSDNNALVRRSVWEQIPIPMSILPRIRSGPSKSSKPDGKGAMRMMAGLPFARFRLVRKTAAQFRRIACAVSFVRLCLVTKRQAHAAHLAGVDTQRSRLCARVAGFRRSHFGTVAKMPLHNLMRAIGHYLGSRAQRLPECVRNWLSRDRRMMHGLPTSGWRTRKTQP